MDSLSYQKLAMLGMSDACIATYSKTGLISDLGKAASGAKGDDFQKLLDKKAQEKDPLVENPPKAETPAKKTDKVPVQKKEEPSDDAKALSVYLAPVPQEVLAQYPAEWLPANLQEGEPVFCIGVRTGANGEDIPILVGADEAAKLFGKEITAPQMMDVSDPEADTMLEATAPGADNSPAAMLEKVTAQQFGQEVQQAVEEGNPQQAEDDQQVELLDVEQAPQRIFYDVEAAPVKVGEVYDAQQTEEPNVAQQVDAQLIQAMQRGDSVVRVQLNPEHLGSVTVEISQSADGILRIALSAHSTETRSLLERHAADLQGLVSSRTQQQVQVDVQHQAESQQSQNQQRQQNYDGHNGQPQDGQEHRRQHRHTSSQDFMQQLRLGLIPDGEF